MRLLSALLRPKMKSATASGIAARWSRLALAFPPFAPSSPTRQASLGRPLPADHKTKRAPAHVHAFAPWPSTSLPPCRSEAHYCQDLALTLSPTCFSMQCAAFFFFFHAGTKCQLTKSICAPPSCSPREWGEGESRRTNRQKGRKKWRKCCL